MYLFYEWDKFKSQTLNEEQFVAGDGCTLHVPYGLTQYKQIEKRHRKKERDVKYRAENELSTQLGIWCSFLGEVIVSISILELFMSYFVKAQKLHIVPVGNKQFNI